MKTRSVLSLLAIVWLVLGTTATAAAQTDGSLDFALAPPLTAGTRPDAGGPNPGSGVAAINSQIAPLALRWSESGGVFYLTTLAIAGGDASPSGDPLAAFNTTGDSPFAPGSHSVSFVCPGSGRATTVATAEVWVGDTNPGAPRVAVTSFDSSGAVLEQLGLTASSGMLSFTAGPIAQITFVDTGGDGHTVDDLAWRGLNCDSANPEAPGRLAETGQPAEPGQPDEMGQPDETGQPANPGPGSGKGTRFR